MSSRWIMAALGGSLVALGATTALTAQAPGESVAQQLLAEHNRARAEAGVPRLAWNDKLARHAQDWAQVLASEGNLRHAGRSVSNGAGENLWAGSAGFYGADAMVGAFVEERRHYVHGNFPRVSRTGNWQDVGHYTQVVWRETREVGCAVARGARDDFLVCRYWPAGNMMGRRTY